ncbi:unnamed protein product [Dovyalis caffra]|uniref:Uncharacterized protein n=1 Tax=Dovyalis caffra TaxID=77055 RepID=A0AAV1SJM5_9ROSI|nr:unnamed protein product [Dovyalis caffra]
MPNQKTLEPDPERFEGYKLDPDRTLSRGDEPDNKHDFDAGSKPYDLGLKVVVIRLMVMALLRVRILQVHHQQGIVALATHTA